MICKVDRLMILDGWRYEPKTEYLRKKNKNNGYDKGLKYMKGTSSYKIIIS